MIPITESRKFIFEGKRLVDLDPTKTPEEIKALHAGEIPELTTAVVSSRMEGATRVHEFKKSAGKKG